MKSQLAHLVKMQLYASKKHLPLFLILALFYPAVFRGDKADMISYVFCVTLVGFTLFNSFAESDDKYKTSIMLNTLPVKRREIIDARFISLYLVYAAVTAVYLIAAFILHLIKPDVFGLISLSTILIGIAVVSFVNAIQMPLYYIYNLQKSRMISMILLFGILFGMAILAMQPWSAPILNYINGLSTGFICVIFLLIAMIIFFINRSVCEMLYRRKEF